MSVNPPLADWVAHIFDHPVTEPAWHWEEDAHHWDDTPASIVELISQTFARADVLLAGFSDAQLNQGVWYLVSNSEHMFSLVDLKVPADRRVAALQSFVPFFEKVMAQRCSAHLSQLDEPGANPLNSACYMWWDILPIHGSPEMPERRNFDTEVLRVFERLLAIGHDACRESALHGLGHWVPYYPEAAATEFRRRKTLL